MQFTLEKLPQSLQEFEELVGTSRTPEKVCALFLCAVSLFDRDKDAGAAAMNILRGPRPMTPYDVQFLRDRLSGKPYLPLAYFDGATPQNGYKPSVPYVLNVKEDPRPQDVEQGYLRVFLQTTGADSPRPMKLRQKGSTGEWFLWEYSSVLVGIRTPASEDPWA
jgi:hypothetical protein